MGHIIPFRTADSAPSARSLIIKWVKGVEGLIRAGELLDIDHRVARALANFPSANKGVCWPGQARLASTLGITERTVRRSIARFKHNGLLSFRRRAFNASNRYTLLLDGQPLFAAPAYEDTSEDTRVPTGEDTRVLMHMRTRVSSYPDSKGSKIESLPPPPRPDSLPRAKRSGEGSLPTIGELTDRVIERLGQGDQDAGWAIYRPLPDHIRSELRHLEILGELTAEALVALLANARGPP